ncbi:MAG: hypothetical protein KME07_24720 [Pegethrix bostrychoides GSE-TBD4-15B]|jgi:hypothetical protein|uniref:Uncharacterized protein n=1 Tax=Pegethrix bostrychoides GSE-TBD4-15B TaxID=2839662 RepID=A0A951PFA4_9CYAN|nr:hypothetical protein [Pegethrix bostrychoides GSE-TBD4-15B]
MTLDLLKAVPKPVLVPFAKAAGLKPLPDQHLDQHLDQPRHRATAKKQAPDFSQLVVRWHGQPLNAQVSPSRHSADYLVAMHDLVRQIAKIQVAEGAKETAPALSEAAADVLLKQADWRAAAAEPASELLTEPQTAEWKSLTSWLFWQMAQSSHEALQLIEGRLAQVSAAGQWQSGMLRLVVLLDLEGAEQSRQTVDLVMAQPASELLPASWLLQISSLLGQQPMSVAAYLQQLMRQFVITAPRLRQFFGGDAASWLIPGQSWQTGRLKLRLGLAFSPDQSPDQTPDQKEAQLPAPPLVTFTQPSWLEQHMSVAVAQQLTQILLQMPPVAETPAAVIKRAETAIHELQNSVTLASRTFAQQAVTLDELAFRLLWGINRTAYEVMQLTSGLPVRLLQPQQPWASGSLRLAIYLEVRTPQQQWQFDLARRTEFKSPKPPVPDALVQSYEQSWCWEPVELSRLEAEFWQQVEQLAPEISLLRTSTEVNIAAGEMPGLGVVQLKASFEFS